MKKQVLFIHSAGTQDFHQGSSNLLAYLKDSLGDEYNLLYPKMHNPENPEYKLWKVQLEKEFSALDGEAFLIGHSLGASVLLKYLSEKIINCTISGLFMIAAPYWGKDDDWQANAYILPEDFTTKLPQISHIFLYHSHHDEVVPAKHLEYYKQKLPKAHIHILDDNEHYFNNGLPKLIDDIKGL